MIVVFVEPVLELLLGTESTSVLNVVLHVGFYRTKTVDAQRMRIPDLMLGSR
jgi:hypothetical protein